MGNQEKNYTAAMIVIGNEILSGRTLDKNTQHVAIKLNEIGVTLREAATIPDIPDKIIETVQRFAKEYDYVFTTGGIGPTHDDITAETVAEAFGLKMEENPQARQLLEAHYAEDLTDARLKMAQIPVGARLIQNPVSAAPGFIVENVHVMAGIPKIMHAMLDNVLPNLVGGEPVLSESVSCFLPESEMANDLTDIQRDYPDLDVGSYPFFKDGHHGLSVVVRGTDIGMVKNAAIKVQDAIDRKKSERA